MKGRSHFDCFWKWEPATSTKKKTSLFFLVVKTFYMESFVGWFPTVLFRRPAAEEAWNAGAL